MGTNVEAETIIADYFYVGGGEEDSNALEAHIAQGLDWMEALGGTPPEGIG